MEGFTAPIGFPGIAGTFLDKMIEIHGLLYVPFP